MLRHVFTSSLSGITRRTCFAVLPREARRAVTCVPSVTDKRALSAILTWWCWVLAWIEHWNTKWTIMTVHFLTWPSRGIPRRYAVVIVHIHYSNTKLSIPLHVRPWYPWRQVQLNELTSSTHCDVPVASQGFGSQSSISTSISTEKGFQNTRQLKTVQV